MAALALLLATPARAATSPQEMLQDQPLEARARSLGQELRCLVCQNQSIDDSDAELARDLRRLVRERLQAGDSDAAVKSYLVARYGEFILLKPPLVPSTWLLWFGPLAILLAGAGLVVTVLRRQRPSTVEVPLDADEQQRLASLLAEPIAEQRPAP